MSIGNDDTKNIETCTVANRIKQIMAIAFNKNLKGNDRILRTRLMYSIFTIFFFFAHNM